MKIHNVKSLKPIAISVGLFVAISFILLIFLLNKMADDPEQSFNQYTKVVAVS